MFNKQDFPLFTDLYQLSMAQGYYYCQKHEQTAIFEYYIRKLPFQGGYALFAGLGDLLEILEQFEFTASHLEFLSSQGFKDHFLQYLSKFQFKGDIWALSEGDLFFPYEPVVIVKGGLLECQLLETLLLNILNFSSLIATKTARMKYVAGNRNIYELGMRRAQGLGALQATRAALIGGASASSNVLSGYIWNTDIIGTVAHAWIQSFDTELEAFRAYAEIYPSKCSLLVDTYDTLKSGIPNAIIVAKELESKGFRLKAIRLDSGDLSYLSQEARRMLDQAGLDYVQIIASNDLDEYLIKSLIEQGAKIDGFGIGTRLVTAKDQPALGGVYKLTQLNEKPRIKISENIAKINLPGEKQVLRFEDEHGIPQADAIILKDEMPPSIIYHPFMTETEYDVSRFKPKLIHTLVASNGIIKQDKQDIATIAQYAQKQLAILPNFYKRFENPHIYPVGISAKLAKLRTLLITSKK